MATNSLENKITDLFNRFEDKHDKYQAENSEKQERNHREQMAELNTIHTRLENHSERIKRTESDISAFAPRISMNEKIAYTATAIIVILGSIATFIIGGIKNSSRILVQEELKNQNYLANQVVSAIGTVAEIKSK